MTLTAPGPPNAASSTFCAARAAGAAGGEALAFANLASGVTVKKIGTTGTASPAEIIQKFEENSR